MKEFELISNELIELVNQWVPRLTELPEDLITRHRNSQNRSIKMITGHMVDSASNNTHRVVHLQYQESPLIFPDYAHFGNNDRWIAIQNYQHENWQNLVQLWKFINLHYAHLILQVNPAKLNHVWISGLDEKISLQTMITDFPRHFKLHLGEIEELIKL